MTHGQDEPVIETWPQLLENGHQPPDEVMNTSRLLELWNGESKDDYALASVVGTIAVTLRTMGKADNIEAAQTMAQSVWDSRDKLFLPRK